MAIWDDILTERDKQVFAKAGYGAKQGFGKRPAVLVIDVNYNFVGDEPEPILKSVERWRNSCGEEGWQGVYAIQRLLKAAREKNIPVLYSTGNERERLADSGRWSGKNARTVEDFTEKGRKGNEIVKEIAPQPNDFVIRKGKPSVFFGTPLMSILNELDVDTLLVCGTTTSGCVRATVIDAFSYNFKVSLIEEGTFDRSQSSHKINLCDMNMKYADVISLEEAEKYLAQLSSPR
ncbi:MAG: isochorismatase family protein [Deltaproteobacteria bacterium]|nr:isochorismatase family protein [Deltaproteobacteria bacterium]